MSKKDIIAEGAGEVYVTVESYVGYPNAQLESSEQFSIDQEDAATEWIKVFKAIDPTMDVKYEEVY